MIAEVSLRARNLLGRVSVFPSREVHPRAWVWGVRWQYFKDREMGQGCFNINFIVENCVSSGMLTPLCHMADKFMSTIGSRYGVLPGSRENSLYNALWVAQALLRKG
ncbi:hypothetical protein BHM03_00043707 [Ensete ventricosum]|nr:hypothetical protein BHM03_00043707 [Ensete ventricosum]